MPRIVLASSSPYRRRLLERFGLDFCICTPEVDETPVQGESVEALVTRLCLLKARTVAAQHPGAVVIASDQAGAGPLGLLGKPGSVLAAERQLRSVSGQEVVFLTGLCVMDGRSGRELVAVERCTVRFRVLSDASIRDYVERERPLDCAGSFKVEGLGIALFDKLTLDDPTALEGLPLIRLTGFLSEVGIHVLAP